jgi:hypothetical protein
VAIYDATNSTRERREVLVRRRRCGSWDKAGCSGPQRPRRRGARPPGGEGCRLAAPPPRPASRPRVDALRPTPCDPVTRYPPAQARELKAAGVKFLFIESICNDLDVLQRNYLNKMLYSQDYQGVDMTQVGQSWACFVGGAGQEDGADSQQLKGRGSGEGACAPPRGAARGPACSRRSETQTPTHPHPPTPRRR